LGCYGDGGALFTNEDELAEKFRWIRVHGQERKHHHPILGVNGRMDTLQAAILLAIFEVFPEEVIRRQEIGNLYTTSLSKTSGIRTPSIAERNTSVYAQYTILSDKRETIQETLKLQGIPSVSYYTVPLHLQPVFASLGHKKGDFPVSEDVAGRCLSLPMNPYLSKTDQQSVIQGVYGA
jgi:UDP-2-acetamido-2-deoxy-ribo-hexuluronate aminotransferase